MRRTIKQLVVHNPAITVEDLTRQITEAGHTPGKLTVVSIRSDTLDTMNVLRVAGLLKSAK